MRAICLILSVQCIAIKRFNAAAVPSLSPISCSTSKQGQDRKQQQFILNLHFHVHCLNAKTAKQTKLWPELFLALQNWCRFTPASHKQESTCCQWWAKQKRASFSAKSTSTLSDYTSTRACFCIGVHCTVHSFQKPSISVHYVLI